MLALEAAHAPWRVEQVQRDRVRHDLAHQLHQIFAPLRLESPPGPLPLRQGGTYLITGGLGGLGLLFAREILTLSGHGDVDVAPIDSASLRRPARRPRRTCSASRTTIALISFVTEAIGVTAFASARCFVSR